MNEQNEPVRAPIDDRHVIESDDAITPQGGCGTCGQTAAKLDPLASSVNMPSHVYAIGRIEARFPNMASEKEFAQATSRANTAGKTDQQAFHAVMSQRENRYLVRQMCWVLTIQGMDTYLLMPGDPADVDLLVEAIRHAPNANDVDVVIGLRGPLAPPTMCNGLVVPILLFDQIYSFDRASLISAIPAPKTEGKASAANFAPAAEELFNRVMQLTDNAGATDEHRALNYLAMRYPGIYAKAAEQFGLDASLTRVEVRQSPLSSTRNIVDVIFSYTHRKTDFVDQSFVRVDVTEQFPFLVTKMSPYYSR